ncbi:MAG: ATP-dependent helicase HrpA [Myxococcota bacterium]|nr:ATP-dependent helicase HrpA [Myxococcota bacterium]
MFADDVLHCPCGGRRSVVAFVANPSIVRAVLDTLGLAAEPATFAPARAPPQSEFGWDDSA